MSGAAYRIDGRLVPPEAFYAVACDPARSVAVEACAGAGKTWMLVSRILRALLDGAEPQDILAITFTRKAAGEMRQRLQQELARWATLPDAALAEALRQRGLSAALAAQRLPEARGLHARVQASGRPVQLRTFHSWFAALLRGAPLSVLQQLRLPPQYELQEDDEAVLQPVWPRFFAAVQADAAARADFVASVQAVGRHQTLLALQKAVARRVEFTLADAAGVVDASVTPWAGIFPEGAGFATPDDWLLGASGVRAALQAAATVLGRAPQKTYAAHGVRLERGLSEGRADEAVAALVTQKGDPRKFNDTLAADPAVQAAQDAVLRCLQARRQHAAWEHHQRLARLTRVLLHSHAELKRERGWVDMNDVESAARRLLGDAELSGWLQQRLDARVRHLLIDEFQDTNPLQWQALYGWLSAYAGAGAGEAPGVFLVGDPKQSIYRFRRAEPQVFKAAQAFVVDGLGGALLSCDHTRRCAPAVVDAVNAVLGQAVQDGDYGEAVGAAFRPHTTGSTEGGAVLSLPAVPREAREGAEAGTGPDAQAWRDSLLTPRHEPEDSLAAREAAQAADWIAHQIATGQVPPGEVMVLARKRERLGWLHTALLERGIAAEQPEKTALGEAPAVQDVVALLDALVSPAHDMSLARALRSPLLGWGDADLAALARRQRADATPGARWWDVLHAAAAADDAPALWRDTAARLARWRGWVQQLPPHDALAALYREADVLARCAASVPPSQRAATLASLRGLLAASLAVEGGRFLTPYRFVRALRAGGLTSAPPAGGDAVRLLTIHGAKGLEAHTVLLLDTDGGPPRSEAMGVLVDWPGEAPMPRRFAFLASEKAAPVCADEALAVEQRARALEELNALYVALTRAGSRLVLSSFEPYRRGAAPTWWQRVTPLAEPLPAPEPAGLADATGATEPFALAGLPDAPPLADAAPGPDAVTEGEAEAEADEATRIGRATHRLLQWCPTPAAGFDWTDAHLQAVARAFELAPSAAREALAGARQAIAGPAAWAWDPQRVDHWGNEVELLHQGRLLRLDRLVRERDGGAWWVLDFKRHDAPEREPAYLAQMRDYRDALRAIHPGAPLRLAFITARGRLVELAPDRLDA